MKTEDLNLNVLSTQEAGQIYGGGWIGVVIGICSLVIAGAAAKGYYDGKMDCDPPPCT